MIYCKISAVKKKKKVKQKNWIFSQKKLIFFFFCNFTHLYLPIINHPNISFIYHSRIFLSCKNIVQISPLFLYSAILEFNYVVKLHADGKASFTGLVNEFAIPGLE